MQIGTRDARAAACVMVVVASGCGVAAPPSPAAGAAAFGPLIERLSESGGYFDTDNLISNETSFLQVADALDARPPGGIYIGVGPAQNFSYIARLRPEWAFIVDIRRDNVLQHLAYAALLARADDPYGFLCGLLSRDCPELENAPEGIEATLGAIERARPVTGVLRENMAAIRAHIDATIGFAVTEDDAERIEWMLTEFFREQLSLRFRTHGQPTLRHHPTLASLLRARSPSARHGHFLASSADYAVVRDLSRRGRIVPVVGDFAGEHALREIGVFARERGLAVGAVYVSNVEFYLIRQRRLDAYVNNLRRLPFAAGALFIRAYFDYGLRHPAALPGHRSTTVLQPIRVWLDRHERGELNSYWDVATSDYLP